MRAEPTAEQGDVGVQIEGQLLLDLGDGFFADHGPARPTIELDVVVCLQCTGHHPTERCPQRVVCELCSGRHRSSSHLGTT